MTRINLVSPAELCDQHLLAEHRELTRIPNAVARGKYSLAGQPADYVLGTGHVRFFFDKLHFLHTRYQALHAECLARGFRVRNIWPDTLPDDPSLWRDYIPTETALQLNRARIAERMPARARFTPRKDSGQTWISGQQIFSLADQPHEAEASQPSSRPAPSSPGH